MAGSEYQKGDRFKEEIFCFGSSVNFEMLEEGPLRSGKKKKLNFRT